MKINDLQTLLVEEMKDIYDFEKRLVRAIPKMAKAASSEELRSGLLEHLEVTKGHVERVEEVFELLGVPAKAKTCSGMKGIIEEGDETIGQDADETLMDVAITGAAQRVEHYEMAAYASARAMAEQLGHSEVAQLLQKTWAEEQEADETLSELASKLLTELGGRAPEQGGEDRRRQSGRTQTARSSRGSA